MADLESSRAEAPDAVNTKPRAAKSKVKMAVTAVVARRGGSRAWNLSGKVRLGSPTCVELLGGACLGDPAPTLSWKTRLSVGFARSGDNSGRRPTLTTGT